MNVKEKVEGLFGLSKVITTRIATMAGSLAGAGTALMPFFPQYENELKYVIGLALGLLGLVSSGVGARSADGKATQPAV